MQTNIVIIIIIITTIIRWQVTVSIKIKSTPSNKTQEIRFKSYLKKFSLVRNIRIDEILPHC
jgi:hypothetical protein